MRCLQGLGCQQLDLKSKPESLTAGGSVHQSHGHLNLQAVHLLPYSFPRSSVLYQLTTATSNASTASFLRHSSTARYPQAMVGRHGTVSSSLKSHISDTDTSSIPKSHLHTHTSNVIRDSQSQCRNGKSRLSLRHHNIRAFHKWNVPQNRSSGTAIVQHAPHQGVSLVSWDYRGSYP